MKFVALALGLLATAFALAVDYYLGALQQPLLVLLPDSGSQLLGLSLLHMLAGAGVVAGLLAFPSPLSGGLLLLAAACGWFGLGTSIPDGFSVAVVVLCHSVCSEASSEFSRLVGSVGLNGGR